MERIKILTFSGSSGVGKTTVVNELLKLKPAPQLVTSLTTRRHRQTDLLHEYRYVSEKEFEKLKKQGEFLWVVSVHNNSYGTLRSSVNSALAREGISLMILTPDVIPILLGCAPKGVVVPMFITPPSEQILRERLKKRGEENEVIDRRISDCAAWHKSAKVSGIPYEFIDNEGTVDETIAKIARFLKKGKDTQCSSNFKSPRRSGDSLWAVRDSNPRPLRCKRSALIN